jgi:hypothetical protein
MRRTAYGGLLLRQTRLELALAALRQGADDARECGVSIWEFAIEIDRLHAAGVTNNDLRLLLSGGLIEHRLEIRSLAGKERHFRTIANMCFTMRSCFVLTTAGHGRATAQEKNGAAQSGSAKGHGSSPALVPCWDAELRQLQVGGQIVKEFRQPSTRQVAVLSAFQSQGWPPRIDDPLSAPGQDSVHGLLHYTIQNLNRYQVLKLIHFYGDGTRRGVRWRLVND